MTTDIQIIAPESLHIVETYIECGSDIEKTALALNSSPDVIASHLAKREARTYLDQLFATAGFRNRDRMFGLLDEIVNKKLEEMEDSGLGTTLDIVELLEKVHKMKMQELTMSMKLAEIEKANAPAVQNNTQINITGSESYNKLIEKIIQGKKQ